jgi:hypothetical protein
MASEEPASPSVRARHILALDGGGVRGVVTLQMLRAFEERFGTPACEFFDMFAGTSTGAIIAALLAFRRSTAGEILQLYRDLIPEVFPRSWRTLKPVRPFVPAIYSRDSALERLEELFGDATLGSLASARPADPQAILLTTHDLVRDEELFLSSYPFQGGNSNYGTTWMVRDAVAASALSAPWYFGPYQGRFIDGGVSVFNTPARQAAIEALDYCDRPSFEPGRTVLWSFGSGTFSQGIRKWEADDWPAVRWTGRLYSDIQSDAEADQIYGAMRMVAHREIEFRRYQITIAPETISSLGVPIVTPGLPIALDRADALEFLDDLGRRFAERIDWDRKDGFLLRPPRPDPFKDSDLWRSATPPPPRPPKPPSARLA